MPPRRILPRLEAARPPPSPSRPQRDQYFAYMPRLPPSRARPSTPLSLPGLHSGHLEYLRRSHRFRRGPRPLDPRRSLMSVRREESFALIAQFSTGPMPCLRLPPCQAAPVRTRPAAVSWLEDCWSRFGRHLGGQFRRATPFAGQLPPVWPIPRLGIPGRIPWSGRTLGERDSSRAAIAQVSRPFHRKEKHPPPRANLRPMDEHSCQTSSWWLYSRYTTGGRAFETPKGGLLTNGRSYRRANTYLIIFIGASSLAGGVFEDSDFDFDDDNPLDKEMKMPCPPIWGPLSVLRNIPKLYV